MGWVTSSFFVLASCAVVALWGWWREHIEHEVTKRRARLQVGQAIARVRRAERELAEQVGVGYRTQAKQLRPAPSPAPGTRPAGPGLTNEEIAEITRVAPRSLSMLHGLTADEIAVALTLIPSSGTNIES